MDKWWWGADAVGEGAWAVLGHLLSSVAEELLQVGIGTTRLPAGVLRQVLSGAFHPAQLVGVGNPVTGLGFAGQLWPKTREKGGRAPISESICQGP